MAEKGGQEEKIGAEGGDEKKFGFSKISSNPLTYFMTLSLPDKKQQKCTGGTQQKNRLYTGVALPTGYTQHLAKHPKKSPPRLGDIQKRYAPQRTSDSSIIPLLR